MFVQYLCPAAPSKDFICLSHMICVRPLEVCTEHTLFLRYWAWLTTCEDVYKITNTVGQYHFKVCVLHWSIFILFHLLIIPSSSNVFCLSVERSVWISCHTNERGSRMHAFIARSRMTPEHKTTVWLFDTPQPQTSFCSHLITSMLLVRLPTRFTNLTAGIFSIRPHKH